jgi:hypothetical protein
MDRLKLHHRPRSHQNPTDCPRMHTPHFELSLLWYLLRCVTLSNLTVADSEPNLAKSLTDLPLVSHYLNLSAHTQK